MTTNLRDMALVIADEIYRDILGDGQTDIWWDLEPVLMVEQTPQGQAPATKYILTTYTKSLILGQSGSTVSAFDVIPSPLLVLDAAFMRELIANGIRFVREMRSNQLTSPQ